MVVRSWYRLQLMKKSLVTYVIEDELDIAELVRFNLALEGFQVETFASGEDGLKRTLEKPCDILLLDLMLPGVDGLEVCAKLRANQATKKLPIIMMTAKGEEQDVVRGLEMGADDYVTKPFSPKVLMARIQAVLRRAERPTQEDKNALTKAGLTIDPGRVEVFVNGAKVDLTQSEFKILQFLAQRPGWVFTRTQIVEAIRGENYAVTDRTIDFQMVGLRKKMGELGSLIETVRGVGYRFKDL